MRVAVQKNMPVKVQVSVYEKYIGKRLLVDKIHVKVCSSVGSGGSGLSEP